MDARLGYRRARGDAVRLRSHGHEKKVLMTAGTTITPQDRDATSGVTIAIDAMGGDHAPVSVLDGVEIAAKATRGKVHYELHGDAARIEPLLVSRAAAAAASTVKHTDKEVLMTDKPSDAIRRSRGSSMWNALSSVKAGEAHVAVSAGNTGALMAISKVVLRMMANVHRPAIAANWPTPRGHSVVLDVGANVSTTPRQLVEFAIMGEAFHRAVHGTARPSVGLLNVGQEELKGNEVVRAAARLLGQAHLDLDYVGFVEGDDISLGRTDVVVTDGFTGNIALKSAEGTARLVAGYVREALTSSLLARLAAAVLQLGALPALRKRMDPGNANGGVFLGLRGVVVKSHGGANGASFATALRIAVEMARSEFHAEVARNLDALAKTPDTDLSDEPPAADVRATSGNGRHVAVDAAP